MCTFLQQMKTTMVDTQPFNNQLLVFLKSSCCTLVPVTLRGRSNLKCQHLRAQESLLQHDDSQMGETCCCFKISGHHCHVLVSVSLPTFFGVFISDYEVGFTSKDEEEDSSSSSRSSNAISQHGHNTAIGRT
jgi:hypothetical protein